MGLRAVLEPGPCTSACSGVMATPARLSQHAFARYADLTPWGRWVCSALGTSGAWVAIN
jgi:hypothetical protein